MLYLDSWRFAYGIAPNNPTSIGWVLTALFYSALHYVEAYNAKFNAHFQKHEDLSRDIGRNPQLLAIHDDYKDLSAFSWNARYRPVSYGASQMEEAKQYHASVEKHVSDLLGIAMPEVPKKEVPQLAPKAQAPPAAPESK